jgi:hypothetical protein
MNPEVKARRWIHSLKKLDISNAAWSTSGMIKTKL